MDKSRAIIVVALTIFASLILTNYGLPAQAQPAPLLREIEIVGDPSERFDDFARESAFDGARLAIVSESTTHDLVYLYQRSGTDWVAVRTIDTGARVTSVALDGDALAVGQPSVGSGRVLVFDTSTPAADPVEIGNPFSGGNRFGFSIALDGSRLVASSFREDGGRAGRAAIFEKAGTGWTLAQTGQLSPGREVDPDSYGSTVDISGDLAVTQDHSAAYVFRRGQAGWSLDGRLEAPTSERLDPTSGVRVGEGLVVMTPNAFVTPGDNKVYVWFESAGSWSVSASFVVPADVDAADFDGTNIEILDQAGTVHSYDRADGDWAPSAPTPVNASGDIWSDTFDEATIVASHGRVAVTNPNYWPDVNVPPGRVTVLRHEESIRPPAAPANVRAVPSPSYGLATVSWTAPPGPAVTGYTVQAVPRLEGWPAPKVVVPGGALSTRITGMQELAEYQFVVQAQRSGNAGPWSSPSPRVRLGGPLSVPSPQTFTDPAGDQDDPRLDITAVTLDINASVATLGLRRAAAADVYTDPIYQGIFRGATTLVVFGTAPYRNGRFLHQTANDTSSRIQGEDFIFWWQYRSSCAKRAFPVRQVNGVMQVTLPMACLDDATAVRVRVGSRDPSVNFPPVTRIRQTGTVKLTNLRITEVGKKTPVTSVYIGPSTAQRFEVSFDATSASGIDSAEIWPFSLTTGTRPARLVSQTCTKTGKVSSTCRAIFSAAPYEIRNQDVGRWRVFAKVTANDGSILIKDDRDTAVLLRRSSRLTSTASKTAKSYLIDARLQGADWNKRAWANLSGQKVLLQKRKPGSTAFRTIRELTTKSDGSMRTSVSLTERGTYRLVYYGTSQQSVRKTVLTVR